MTAFLTTLAAFGWIGAWIFGSILNRRRSAKPVFPRVPDGAVFAEAWRSGRSLDNALSRIGGARNCLLVYVADGALTIVPVFPFNLMFLPEIYGLELTAPLSEVSATPVDGMFGRRVLVTVAGPRPRRFELYLRDPQGFQDAIEGKSVIGAPKRSAQPHRSWQVIFVRLFALIWGVSAGAAGFTGLAKDIDLRLHGEVAVARVVAPSGDNSGRNAMAVLQYDVGDRTFTLVSSQRSGPYRIGETEKVRFRLADPADAREDGDLSFDLLFAGLASGMLVLALAFGRIARAFSRALNV